MSIIRRTIHTLSRSLLGTRFNLVTDRRIGRFTVSDDLALSYSSEVLRVLGKCVVLRAEHDLVNARIEYLAICDHFRPIAEGEIAPSYAWFFTSDADFWCKESTVWTEVAP